MPTDASLNVFILASIISLSSSLSASFNSAIADSILALSSASTFSPNSSSVFSVACTSWSPWFLMSTVSLKVLSSSAFDSASEIICSISSSERPLDACMTIFCSFPVSLSLAETLMIPLASISKITSICGNPLGLAGISVRSNLPNDLLS